MNSLACPFPISDFAAEPRMAHIIKSLFSTSDEQLMWRVKLQDDPQAFASLMARWQKPILRLCVRMTGDQHRAEDLTQTAFSRVFSGRAAWEPSGKFSTFLWRIALNLCHDELRRAKRRGECSLEELAEDGARAPAFLAADEPSPDVQADNRERADLVRQSLLRLAPPYREVVVLRHYERLKFFEIADLLEIPEGTVKSRMAEALNQLTRLLKPLREDPSCQPRTQIPELLAL
jgi:RNA polymerase sigma-70 factor (ECF subfamily)